MNIAELWEYLSLQKTMFTDKFVGIIASNNKFYSIEIKNGMWIHYPSWASTINSIHDLGMIKFPVRLHLEQLPPYECLMDLYKSSGASESLRLGQWFYNKHLDQMCPAEIYEERDAKAALELIFDAYYTV